MRLMAAVFGIFGFLCGLADAGQPIRITRLDNEDALRLLNEHFRKSQSCRQDYKIKIIPPDCPTNHKIKVIRPESGIDYKIRIYDPCLKKWQTQKPAEKWTELLRRRCPKLFDKLPNK